ncbi:MAG: ATP/GTP-binding protein [Methanomassiliicoccaceae archaeon]|jgi:GTPase SAR1 family protein|nr:ATP/GTP-binding protein [Methanomassiliicoccaceae archaeon]
MKNIYFVGTAGSGKSSLVRSYKEWLDLNGIDSVIVNMDPGADALPYVADIDIREWIDLQEVMDEYALGPNGAQVVCADLMAMNISKLTDALSGYKTSYALIDTPGQLELFAFRRSSEIIAEALGRERSMTVFLADPMLCRSSNGFISSMMLSSIVQFRLHMPMINILSKADVLNDDELDKVLSWFSDPDALYGDLMDNDTDPQTVIGMELFKAMENIGVFGDIRAVSSKESFGMEELYAASQQAFFGGDDAEVN